MKDLLEYYEELPSEVRAITDKLDGDESYEDCARIVSELNALSYHAEYGLDGELHSLVKIPQFPLGVPNMIVSEFMRMDCFENKDNFHPTPRGVMYMSGELKTRVFKTMKEVYYNDKPFRNWFLKELPLTQKKKGNVLD